MAILQFLLGLVIGSLFWPIPCIVLALVGSLIVGLLYGAFRRKNTNY